MIDAGGVECDEGGRCYYLLVRTAQSRCRTAGVAATTLSAVESPETAATLGR